MNGAFDYELECSWTARFWMIFRGSDDSMYQWFLFIGIRSFFWNTKINERLQSDNILHKILRLYFINIEVRKNFGTRNLNDKQAPQTNVQHSIDPCFINLTAVCKDTKRTRMSVDDKPHLLVFNLKIEEFLSTAQ